MPLKKKLKEKKYVTIKYTIANKKKIHRIICFLPLNVLDLHLHTCTH